MALIPELTCALTNATGESIEVRKTAEAQLKQFESMNFPLYLGGLCQHLCAEQLDASTRAQAGLQLKNLLVAHHTKLDDQERLNQRWLGQPEQARSQIKAMLMGVLGTPVKLVRSTASSVIASIGATEIPVSQWQDLVSQLVSNINPQNAAAAAVNADLRQSSFEALGFLCEKTGQLLSAHSNSILNAIHSGMRPEEADPQIKYAATSCLRNCIDFVRDNFSRQAERDLIMRMVFDVSKNSKEERIRQVGFECLVQIVVTYYEQMNPYIESIFELTRAAMVNEEEDVSKQAFEVWLSISEEESDRFEETEENKKEQKPGPPVLGFVEKAIVPLTPILLQSMAKQPSEKPDDSEYCVAEAAALTLAAFTRITGNKIVPLVFPFIEGNVQSPGFRLREAAILAFCQILDGPDSELLAPLVSKAFPLFCNSINDPCPLVQDTAAWTLSQVCKYMPEILDQHVSL
jgi:importin subunit beta-1